MYNVVSLFADMSMLIFCILLIIIGINTELLVKYVYMTVLKSYWGYVMFIANYIYNAIVSGYYTKLEWREWTHEEIRSKEYVEDWVLDLECAKDMFDHFVLYMINNGKSHTLLKVAFIEVMYL